MLFSTVTEICILALVGLAAASPIELTKRADVVIGYRRASKEQAADYNAKKTLTFDPNWENWGKQIGTGVYTTPDRDSYEPMADPESWYCIITADSAALDAVHKAWIPQKSGTTKLWFGNDDVINAYIKGLDASWDPEKTLRLSIIAGMKNGALEMLIPPKLLNDQGGNLKIKVQCKEKKEEITDTPTNYDTWKNVKGSKQ
ncbi:hypothetical protein F4810DRAFT_611534 [Camillea tinctor]|nr:hypothetical protein F4810DRAFT_611534 [Camillea tinctor]